MASGYASSCPVVTDTTAATDTELREAVGAFLPPGTAARLTFERASGGVNNANYYVTEEGQGGLRYVLRLYRNGFNEGRIRYEHAVLRALSGMSLPFELPRPLPALGSVGAATTYVALSSSRSHACAFPCIPGGAPSLADARAIGCATATLVRAMADISVAEPCCNPLYRNFFDAHHLLTREAFFECVRGPAIPDAVRQNVDWLTERVLETEDLIERIMAAGGLPEQQIHADLHHGESTSG